MLFKSSLLAVLLTAYVTAFETVVDSYTSQNDLSVFKDVKCNRTEWVALVKPFLEAQGLALGNPEDKSLAKAYKDALDAISAWKNQGNNINRVGEICNNFQFVECNEENQCVCGEGKAPYHFELAKDSSICLAKRGSICIADSLCADGLKCENRYCGGVEAFQEESAAGGMAFTAAKASMLLSIVGAMYFVQ